jgi:hypothetical protein
MQFSSRFIQSTFVLGGISLLLATAPAQAGFDWKAPSAPAKKQAAAAPLTNTNGPLTPEIDQAEDLSTPKTLPIPVGVVESAPVDQHISTPQPVQTAPQAAQQNGTVVGIKSIPVKPTALTVVDMAPPPSAPPSVPVTSPVSADPVLEGFGKDIPLALALHEITPSTFAYEFASPEMAAIKISWRGGKIWQDALTDSLAVRGLQFNITGNTLQISYLNKPAAPVAAPPLATIQPVAQPTPITKAEDTLTPMPLAPGVAIVADKPAAPVVDLSFKRKWEARSGATLHQALESWSKDAHVELSWATSYDYPVNNTFVFEGSFNEAVDALLSSYDGEKTTPKGRLYPNLPSGPSVLVIN